MTSKFKTPLILQPYRPRSRPHRLINTAAQLLPEIVGEPVRVRFQRTLIVHRGKLYSRKSGGEPVHAGTDIARRTIVLEQDLANKPAELARILIHEVFHFAWVRLGNPRRNAYSDLLLDEFRRGSRGELGWSAEYRKLDLFQACRRNTVADHPKWREYVCESFCDTAAWRYLRLAEHDEFTLASRYRRARLRWFKEALGNTPIGI
jgi:hypothetical protein